MTQEEKVRAYDKALSVALETYKTQPMYRDWLEKMFPELKESENEMVRKALINGFNKLDKSAVWYNGITNAQILDWLEKQGEKESSYKIEPKFHEGEWIVGANNVFKIISLNDKLNCYIAVTPSNEEVKIPYQFDDGQGHMCSYHLWTIQDAKDGDILICKSDKQPFIFKGFDRFHLNCPVAYCGICEDGTVGIHTGDGWWTDKEVLPATKEQREWLLKSIADAGYIWDAKEKQLKEADSYCQEHCKGYQETGKCFADGECKAKRDVEQKSTDEEMKTLLQTEYEKGRTDVIAEKSWSKEDEEMLKMVIKLCEQYGNEYAYYWLKSLKDRVKAQPKQEWSEEDEERIKNIISVLDVQVCWDGATGKKGNPYQKEIDWLKSLRPHSQWKPSEEQIEILDMVLTNEAMDDNIARILRELREQLKKLKG